MFLTADRAPPGRRLESHIHDPIAGSVSLILILVLARRVGALGVLTELNLSH